MKIIKAAASVLLGISILFLTIRTVLWFLPYNLDYSITGDSMYPTIMEGGAFLWTEPEKAAFDDLHVGDIIVFRKRTDWNSASQGIVFRTRENEDGEKVLMMEKVGNSIAAKDEGIEYLPGEFVVHRVVEIREADDEHDRALITKGDHNTKNDTRAVFESGYSGKVVWHANHLGNVFQIMYRRKMVYVMEAVALILFGIVTVHKYSIKREDGGEGDEADKQ